MTQSKLSDVLASTLLRFREIDRDTIESLCKRAATLEHQVTQNSADINRETALRQMVQERGEEVTKLKAELSAWRTAENQLSNAYIRLRVILDAVNTCPGTITEAIWEHTEARAQALVKSHTQLQWALRNLLAHTRDVEDRCFGNGDGYQSAKLEEAIKQADALVGIDATDAFPIADDALYRRIEELEVALAAEKAKKQNQGVTISADMLSMRVSKPLSPAFAAPYKGNTEAHSDKRNRDISVAEALSALSGRPTPENIAQSPLSKIKALTDQPGFLASAMREAVCSVHRGGVIPAKNPENKTASIIKDRDGEVKVQVGYLGADAVNDIPQPWSEKQLRDLVKDAIGDALKPGGDIHRQYSLTKPSRNGL